METFGTCILAKEFIFMERTRRIAALALVAVVGLAGCAEQRQVVLPIKPGRQR